MVDSIFHHGPLIDIILVVASIIGGWGMRQVCWMRSVDVKLEKLSTQMELVMKHLGLF